KIKPHDENVFLVYAGFRAINMENAAKYQSRDDQQHHSERHFGHDQQSGKQFSALAAARSASAFAQRSVYVELRQLKSGSEPEDQSRRDRNRGEKNESPIVQRETHPDRNLIVHEVAKKPS